MKKASVSLLVVSSSMSLDELSSRLGRDPSSGSHNKGDAHAGAKLGKPSWPTTVWRFDSDASENASVEEHLERMEIQFPAKELKRLLPSRCEVSIDITLFFDSANVSALIPRHGMQIIHGYGAQLELTCYPSILKS